MPSTFQKVRIPTYGASGGFSRAVPAGTTVIRADGGDGRGVLTMIRLIDGRLVPDVFQGPAKLYDNISGRTGVIDSQEPRAWK